MFGESQDILNGLKKTRSCDCLWSPNLTVNMWSMCFSVGFTGLEMDYYTSSRPRARPSAPVGARREVSLTEKPPRIAAESVQDNFWLADLFGNSRQRGSPRMHHSRIRFLLRFHSSRQVSREHSAVFNCLFFLLWWLSDRHLWRTGSCLMALKSLIHPFIDASHRMRPRKWPEQVENYRALSSIASVQWKSPERWRGMNNSN